jgi:hypothetical protein
MLTPYIHPLPEGENVKTLAECAFDVKTGLAKSNTFYSIQQGIKQLAPYLIYKNDVTVHHYDFMKQKMASHIKLYSKKHACSTYVSNPLHEYGTMSASERQFEFLLTDNGRLYTIQMAKLFEMDYKNTLDTHISKIVDTSKPVAPPIVKEYTSTEKMSEKTVYYDEEYDPTNYDELEAYDTPESMMRFLIEQKQMTPQIAFIYAPHFLKRKRIVVNGEYARLTVHDKISYYKRVNNSWKLDETCAGPYPCVSNEPDCDDCVDISFRLKQNLLTSILKEYEIGSYASKIDRTTFIEKREQFLEHRETHLKEIRKRFLTKYNDRFKTLSNSIVVVDNSPNQTLLFSILQKPHDEKYKELTHFIQTKTRVAKSTEEQSWLYCTISDIKLIPAVFVRVLEGYESDKYLSTLMALKQEGLLIDDSANIVTVHGGFIVSSILFVETFDDAIRSSELEDNYIFIELDRDDHPLTPAVVDVLTKLSELFKVDISKYFNYMIHTIVKSQTFLLLQSVALMLKISNIVKNVDMNDKMKLVLLNEDRLKTLLLKHTKIQQEPLTEKSITNEIINVSSYYEIQAIAREKDKKRVTRRVTASTLWETFLPPPMIDVKHPTKSMEIIKEIHAFVNGKVPLREGTYHVNTVTGSFLTERVRHILDHMHKTPFPSYSIHKPFMQKGQTYVYEGDAKIVVLPSILSQDILYASDIDYTDKLDDLKMQLNDVGIEIPHDFIPFNTSLTYMRTFIQNIASVFPKLILTKIDHNYAVPLSLVKLISASRTHVQSLTNMMNTHYYRDLCKFSTDLLNLEELLKDDAIHAILQRIKFPVDDSRIYEYEYYIYVIFLKYTQYGNATNVIQFYIKLLSKDMSKIFLSYDEIKQLTLKDKVTESNKIRLERKKMSATDKYVFDFRQTQNIDENARLGRLRGYNAKHRDAEDALFGDVSDTFVDTDVSDDSNRGDDGNENDDDE